MAISKLPFITKRGLENNKKFYQVEITTSDGFTVIGNMKNQFSYTLNAQWENLFAGLVPGAELLAKLGNNTVLTTGIFSQKYFKGGNHINLTTEFRIYDDGTEEFSPVIQAAKSLSRMVVADSSEIFSNPQALIDELEKIPEKSRNFINNASDEGVAKQIWDKLLARLKSATTNVRTVKLKIGNFFKSNQMIITNINVTYSKEVTLNGPLYGDFSVTLESLQALVRGAGPFGVGEIFQSPEFLIRINGE